MRETLQSRVVHPARLHAGEVNRWLAIRRGRAELGSPFLSPEFTFAAARCRPGVRVCVLLRRGEAAGFLPFQFPALAHRALGAAEPVANPMNDYFGLIAEPDLSVTGGELARLAGLSHLGFTHLDETQLRHGLEAATPEPGLRIRFEQGGEAYWAGLRERDRKFADDTARRERRLEKESGPLQFRFHVPDSAALHHLIARKREQYRRTGGHDLFARPWPARLLEELAGSASPSCAGVLSTLYAGDTWVASHFGLRSGGTLHYWFPVYNRELQHCAPGRLLLKHIVSEGAAHGLSVIDRGSGDTQAKREFANDRHTYYRGAWLRPGLRSTLYRIHCSLRWRLAETASTT